MGVVVLLLALAQGGPGPALAAIGRGAGIVRPVTPTPYNDILPTWQVPGAAPGATPPAASAARAGAATPVPDDMGYSRVTSWSFPDEPRLEAMRTLIVSTLKERELTFKGASGKVSAFYPGEGYQKLWARDLATMLPTVQYFYAEDYLRSGVEEFLARQYQEQPLTPGNNNGVLIGAGALPGIIAPDGTRQKNTVVSDEETSIIHAAYQYYKVSGGVSWLKKDVAGRAVLDRLNAALDWLYDSRLDGRHRLIKRGHTTDWGDVKFERALDPTEMDPRTDHWTASIYDQALTYRALRELAEMSQAAGHQERARTLIALAADLRQATNRFLWMPERGYYRLHIHITPLTHRDFNEDDMVSIGNAIAIDCGLTTDEQERSIIKRLEETRIAAGARKPGLSLFPAYPSGFFATVQRGRGEYQNGGLWDWWGGVQTTAEFEHGYADQALTHLYQIAADWALHPNAIWEWSLPTSAFGRGSKGYASAAGTVGEAIIAGLYGVDISRDGVRIEPRLGTHNGEVHVYQPATDRYVAYRYTYSAAALTLRYGTNSSNDIAVRVLIPAGRVTKTVSINNSEVTARRETVGNDTYAAFKAPAGVNTITISLVPSPAGTAGLAIDPLFVEYYQNNDGQRLLGTALTQAFREGSRRVQYFEKGKLEDMRQTTQDPAWQFSYGLMGEELVRAGADLAVGGDKSTVTYASLRVLMDESKRVPPPKGFKSSVYKNKDGTVFIPFSPDVTAAPGHNVAAIFWVVLSSNTRSPGGWLHDVGLPLTEPIWAIVDKGNQKERSILIQAFQRAILTYDPLNASGWQVERTNLGIDYFKVFPDRARP